MRKLKLIKRLVTPIIMFVTTQGVAGTSFETDKKINAQPQTQDISFRLELNALIKSKQLKELEVYSKSQR